MIKASKLSTGGVEEVFGFKVTVHNADSVQIFEGRQNLEDHIARVSLRVEVRFDDPFFFYRQTLEEKKIKGAHQSSRVCHQYMGAVSAVASAAFGRPLRLKTVRPSLKVFRPKDR